MPSIRSEVVNGILVIDHGMHTGARPAKSSTVLNPIKSRLKSEASARPSFVTSTQSRLSARAQCVRVSTFCHFSDHNLYTLSHQIGILSFI
jgi:hypothetical protein